MQQIDQKGAPTHGGDERQLDIPLRGVREEPMEEIEEEPFTISVENGSYVLTGPSIDRLLNSVNFEDETSLNYFHRMLRKWGVIDALRERGAKEGDSVVIEDMEFDFVE